MVCDWCFEICSTRNTIASSFSQHFAGGKKKVNCWQKRLLIAQTGLVPFIDYFINVIIVKIWSFVHLILIGYLYVYWHVYFGILEMIKTEGEGGFVEVKQIFV